MSWKKPTSGTEHKAPSPSTPTQVHILSIANDLRAALNLTILVETLDAAQATELTPDQLEKILEATRAFDVRDVFCSDVHKSEFSEVSEHDSVQFPYLSMNDLYDLCSQSDEEFALSDEEVAEDDSEESAEKKRRPTNKVIRHGTAGPSHSQGRWTLKHTRPPESHA